MRKLENINNTDLVIRTNPGEIHGNPSNTSLMIQSKLSETCSCLDFNNNIINPLMSSSSHLLGGIEMITYLIVPNYPNELNEAILSNCIQNLVEPFNRLTLEDAILFIRLSLTNAKSYLCG